MSTYFHTNRYLCMYVYGCGFDCVCMCLYNTYIGISIKYNTSNFSSWISSATLFQIYSIMINREILNDNTHDFHQHCLRSTSGSRVQPERIFKVWKLLIAFFLACLVKWTSSNFLDHIEFNWKWGRQKETDH